MWCRNYFWSWNPQLEVNVYYIWRGLDSSQKKLPKSTPLNIIAQCHYNVWPCLNPSSFSSFHYMIYVPQQVLNPIFTWSMFVGSTLDPYWCFIHWHKYISFMPRSSTQGTMLQNWPIQRSQVLINICKRLCISIANVILANEKNACHYVENWRAFRSLTNRQPIMKLFSSH